MIPTVSLSHPNESLAIPEQGENIGPVILESSYERLLGFGENDARGTGRRDGGHEVQLLERAVASQEEKLAAIRLPSENVNVLIRVSARVHAYLSLGEDIYDE